MFTTKKQLAVVASVIGIFLCFLVVAVNQRYNGLEKGLFFYWFISIEIVPIFIFYVTESFPIVKATSIPSHAYIPELILVEAQLEEEIELEKSHRSDSHIKDRQEFLDFIHKQCKKYGKLTVEPGEAAKPRKIVVPKNWREHKLVYASNPKTGSSSFKRWINKMQGDPRPYNEIKHVHQMGKYGKVQSLFDAASQKLGREA